MILAVLLLILRRYHCNSWYPSSYKNCIPNAAHPTERPHVLDRSDVFPFVRRVDREGEVATASTLSRMISAVPMTPGGPARSLVSPNGLMNVFDFLDP